VTGVRRALWTAGLSAVVGTGVWAVLKFGVPAWLTDDKNPVRPVLEALSWIAGIGGLMIAIAALVVARRQASQADNAQIGTNPPTSQTAANSGVTLHGNVTGGAGGGPAIGVNFGHVAGMPDPTVPTRE
jgi:hypothetical protein